MFLHLLCSLIINMDKAQLTNLHPEANETMYIIKILIQKKRRMGFGTIHFVVTMSKTYCAVLTQKLNYRLLLYILQRCNV